MKRKYEIVVLSKGPYARTLRIYAPKKATRAIVYHDGQNVFYDGDSAFGKSWRALELLKKLGIKNTAVIGIDNTPARMNDYLPFPIEHKGAAGPFTGGMAGAYCDYIQSRVIPYLGERFGFEFYGMLGSSAGGLATLAYAARCDKRFRAYGMFSTPLFLSPAAFEKFFEESSFDTTAFYHVYTGGSEHTADPDGPEQRLVPQAFVDDAFTLTNVLRKKGAADIVLDMDNTAIHDEVSWRPPEEIFLKKFSSL